MTGRHGVGGHGAARLPGERLHLHHGPIDLVVGWEGSERRAAFQRAEARFATILDELVAELPRLRSPCASGFRGRVARRMARAIRPHMEVFVTPMAAVAGAVADEVLAAMAPGPGVDRAYVNNGGDIACHLGPGAEMTILGAAGLARIGPGSGVGGIATSGWRGRSQSLGIADAVTVLARNAAAADVAATLIANAVDLPDHPAIARAPAGEVFADSDLGDRPVTTAVGALSDADIARALRSGLQVARSMARRGVVLGATLTLQGRTESLALSPELTTEEV